MSTQFISMLDAARHADTALELVTAAQKGITDIAETPIGHETRHHLLNATKHLDDAIDAITRALELTDRLDGTVDE